MKSKRFEVVLPEWLKAELKVESDKKGISMSEYIKDLLKQHVQQLSQR
jgi:predicted HicB family RNase H-like nuclease